MGRGDSMELVFQRFFSKEFFLKFLRCWVDFGRVLGGENGGQNRFLGGFLRCFFRVRFGIDFLVFFLVFFLNSEP